MMMGYGYGMGVFGLLCMLIIIVGVIYLVIKLVKGDGILQTSEDTAGKILAERYARSEITEEEYKQMKDVLRRV